MSTSVQPDAPTAELPAVMVNSNHERCAACGASLASDQRYCVECGRRLARARLPFMDDPARYGGTVVSPPSSQRPRISASTTLVAGVGTLLLAMGVGVLIGRSAPSNAKGSGPVQVVSAPAASTTGASGATGENATTEATTTATTSTTGAKSPAGKGGKAGAKSAKAALPPAKVVKVGSPGKGPGYQKGHFTGNFFGEGEE